ncbi:type VI secretion system domain-containing protein, partial [Pseudomonas aeruginosa]|nr:type VI secretion system domain-containing protein [Pseudomonas aeruginosa]
DEVLSLEPEVLTRADDKGIESALNWLQAQPGYTTSRNRWLMRLLMARVSEQYGKNEMALHLLAELDSRAREMTLEQWKPELIFEVKARRLRLLRGKAGRSEAEKNRLLPEMESLLAGLIALDPARAAVLCA